MGKSWNCGIPASRNKIATVGRWSKDLTRAKLQTCSMERDLGVPIQWHIATTREQSYNQIWYCQAAPKILPG